MKTGLGVLVALLAACGLCGCSQGPLGASSGGPGARLVSSLPGKWIGQAKLATGNDLVKLKDALSDGKMTGESSLILSADGTGFLKVARQPERPVSWKQEGRKLILTPGAGGPDAQEGAGAGWVATLSDDGQAMSIDMGDVKVNLTKAPSGG